MSRIFRIAEMYHQQDYDATIDLVETVAADILPIPVTHAIVAKTTGTDGEALTLADGKPGQVLVVYLAVDGNGAGTITPVTSTGWATAVLDEAFDSFTFFYVNDTIGWIILGAIGVAAVPVIT